MKTSEKVQGIVKVILILASICATIVGGYMVTTWFHDNVSVHWPPKLQWGTFLLSQGLIWFWSFRRESKENVEEIRLKRIFKQAMQEDWGNYGTKKYWNKEWAVQDAVKTALKQFLMEEDRRKQR